VRHVEPAWASSVCDVTRLPFSLSVGRVTLAGLPPSPPSSFSPSASMDHADADGRLHSLILIAFSGTSMACWDGSATSVNWSITPVGLCEWRAALLTPLSALSAFSDTTARLQDATLETASSTSVYNPPASRLPPRAARIDGTEVDDDDGDDDCDDPLVAFLAALVTEQSIVNIEWVCHVIGRLYALWSFSSQPGAPATTPKYLSAGERAKRVARVRESGRAMSGSTSVEFKIELNTHRCRGSAS